METPPVQSPDMFSMNSAPSQEEKTQAMLCWILSLVASFIVPLIFYIISNDKKFVKHHAAQCLFLSIVMAVVCIVLFITIVGALLVPVVGILGLVAVVLGAIKANGGEWWEVPGIGKMALNLFKV
jgi:uncharacterized protein